jgi:type I restriction enzyme S subunit
MVAANARVGWRDVKFGDVVRQVKNRVDVESSGLERYVAGEHMDTDDLRIRRWGVIGEGYLGPAFHMRFRPGQVLYGSRRTYLRKVAFADFDGICANTTFVLEPNTSDLLAEFLPLVMTTEAFHAHSIKQSKGSVNPYINFRDLTWYEFPLPPAERQREIIEMLQAGQAALDRLREVKDALVALRDAVVAQAESTSADAALGDLLVACDYGISATPLTMSDVPLLRMNNLDGEELDFGDLKWVPASAASPSDFVKQGDILFNRTNSAEHVGKVALVPALDRPMTFASYLLRLRVDDALALPEYIAGFLQSSRGRNRVGAYVTLGVSQANVNATNLKKVRMPVPSVDEQRRIAAQWLQTRELQRVVERHTGVTQASTKALRESLLGGSG